MGIVATILDHGTLGLCARQRGLQKLQCEWKPPKPCLVRSENENAPVRFKWM
jgi:hypothetical protein